MIALDTRARTGDAREEMERTEVAGPVAALLLVVFLLMIGLDPVSHLLSRPGTLRDFLLARPEPWRGASKEGVPGVNRRLRHELEAFEQMLAAHSETSRWLRAPTQLVLLRLGLGNETVYAGPGGWLHQFQSVRHVIGPGFLWPSALAARRQIERKDGSPIEPDPRPALLRLGQDLRARGIRLVLLVVPSKLQVAPETLVRLRRPPSGGLTNPSLAELDRSLAPAGVLRFDPLPVLLEQHRRSGRVPYPKSESHWSPEGMQAVATALARFLEREIALSPPALEDSSTHAWEVEGYGDLAHQLRVADGRGGPLERLTLISVRGPDGRLWRPDRSAEVLLLGDSFTNMFAAAQRGFGVGAGLAEHLSLRLGRAVDRIAIDGAPLATRETLVREIAAGRDRLQGKKVVILELAGRELDTEDWRVVPIPLPRPAATPSARASVARVEAEVAAVAPIADPRLSAYNDALAAVHLIRVRTLEGSAPEELLAYISALRNREPAQAVGLAPGQRLRLRLRPWEEAEAEHGSTPRSELLDDRLLLLPAYYAEPW